MVHEPSRRMTAVVVAGALCLSVPAVLTPHDHDHASHASHASDPHTATTELLNGHDATPHDDHAHATP
jgi:hypothetical protein